MNKRKIKSMAHEAAMKKASLTIARSALLAGEIDKAWNNVYDKEYKRVYEKIEGPDESR